MTDKKKPPESTISFKRIKQDVCGSGDIHIAKSDPIVTKSKLPEPTEPPPPIVAKPKK